MKGEVKTVTFRDAESGYSVLKVIPDNKNLGATITVVGTLPGLEVGDEAEFNGKWGKHKKFGKQLETESYQIILPTSLDGLKTYLASHVKGIGPIYAKRIVDKFGNKTTTILDSKPRELAKIRGITRYKALEIADAWKKDAAMRSQIIKLSSLGISPKLAVKIINAYGETAYKKINENPYQLAEDIWGVGFIKADKIARELGFTHDHPARIAAAIVFTLNRALEDGHLYLSQNELVEKTQELVNASSENIVGRIKQLISQDELVLEGEEAIYLALYHRMESKLAELIRRQQRRGDKKGDGSKLKEQLLDKTLARAEEEQGFALNQGQKLALTTVLQNPIVILTGGPGTGKSTTLNALVGLLRSQGKEIALAAPTGRAAKRMAELTGFEAKTIHRLLKIDRTGKSYYNLDNPLIVDFLVVDEASMLDIILAYRVLAAIGPQTNLLLVGDDNQLPSVQAGNVLGDLISSGKVPVVRLTEIFRQAQESAIVRNAHRINAGNFPELPQHPTDFYFFKEEDTEAAGDLIVDLVQRRIPREFRFDPLNDIQVLAPMYKTACGVGILNQKLQETLNPNRGGFGELRLGYRVLRVKDRVMQTSNNYEKEVFNGEIGIIRSVKELDGETKVSVQFDEKLVEYDQGELDQITLAYAVSIHKSQGSEYPVIVMPMLTSHYIMLARNLLYTGVTRAKELVVLVGSKKAIWIAVHNDKAAQRYTMLAERLQRIG